MSAYISLKSWEKFQHYRDRDPTWVKLYRDTLTSESWVMGTDVSRLVQVASILLAARYNNAIPLNFNLVRKVASLDCTEAEFADAIDHLAAHNYLEINQLDHDLSERSQVASTVLAKCSSEESREEERRGEQSARARESGSNVPHGTSEAETFARWLLVKASYPPNAGRQDWLSAEKYAREIVLSGRASWDEVLAGVERYAAHCRATGRLVANPGRFFADRDEPWNQQWPLPAPKPGSFEAVREALDASIAEKLAGTAPETRSPPVEPLRAFDEGPEITISPRKPGLQRLLPGKDS